MSESKTGSKTDSKTESAQPADLFAQWNEGWRAMAAASGTVNETWSKSILPFMLARATENKSGFGAGNELAEAIERMTQGPRLADVVDFDRKLIGTFAAWTEMQSKLAAYNAVAARPWMRVAEKYKPNQSASVDGKTGYGKPGSQKPGSEDWRKMLGAWTSIASDELLTHQRSDEFLSVQRELLQAATAFRAQQTEISETVSKIMGLPTQSDFDDVTRQLTELRREVRALARRVEATDKNNGAPS